MDLARFVKEEKLPIQTPDFRHQTSDSRLQIPGVDSAIFLAWPKLKVED
jgi:hypothetical protein